MDTVALLPARRIEFSTLIITNYGKEYVPDPSLHMIKSACRDNFEEYEGNRKVIISHTNFIQKTPMPICKRKGIYFFPTHSPHRIENCWINHHHVANIDKIPHRLKTQHGQSIVYFKNGLTLAFSTSYHTMKEQYKRTSECISLIEGT